MRVGIEVGGTFTDLVAIGPDGILVTKVPSVPRAPDEGAFNALVASGIAICLDRGPRARLDGRHQRRAGAQGLPHRVRHHRGLSRPPALQRHGRSRIYDLEYQKPKPVVTRRQSFEVAERMLADGSIATPLDVADVTRATWCRR